MQYTVPKLPLLDYALGLFPNVNLERTLIIGVQHILPTTHSLFNALFSMGLKPENLIILGKCYSTNPDVFFQMKDDGINLSSWSTFFDSHTNFDHQFDNIINRFLREILDQYDLLDYERVIFLDDGGHLLEETFKLSIQAPSLCGIEQTSSGYNRTKHLPFSFPIINLARAQIKLLLETPLVIKEALNCLDRSLKRLQMQDCSVLILGNGVLGGAVHKSLHSSFKVQVYDIDPNKSFIPPERLNTTIESSSLIIGCTGSTSLPQKMHKYIAPSTILASMSSSDREFDAFYLRKQIPLENDCHRCMNIQGVQLLNCGFPINFSDDYPSVDSTDFQITRSLILASIAQISQSTSLKPGFYDLDNDIQQRILSESLHINSPEYIEPSLSTRRI